MVAQEMIELRRRMRLTCWSLRLVHSCRKSAMALRGGSLKPRLSKKSSTPVLGPWYTCMQTLPCLRGSPGV